MATGAPSAWWTANSWPYPAGVFDELVVYVFDWAQQTARVWRIPESKEPEESLAQRHTLLYKGRLHTDTHKGVTGLTVYESEERMYKKWAKPADTWTAAYYEGVFDVTLPPEAWQASGHMLDHLGVPRPF